jgi:hypothetical protein
MAAEIFHANTGIFHHEESEMLVPRGNFLIVYLIDKLSKERENIFRPTNAYFYLS